MGFEMITIDGSTVPSGAPRWNAARYERLVAHLRDALLRRFTVSAFVCQHLRRPVVIRPYDTWRASGASTTEENVLAATSRGEPVRFRDDHRATRWDDTGLPRYRARLGTGLGSASSIDFTPADWERPNTPIGHGSRPIYADTALLHELVHAVRNSWGCADSFRFDPDRRMVWGTQNTEEFYATAIMNMYSSQKGVPLVTSYLDHRPMQFRHNHRGLRDAYARLQHRWIGEFSRQIPTLASDLARLDERACPYNPFRQHRTGDYRRLPIIWAKTIPFEPVGPPAPPPINRFEDVFGPAD